MNIMIFVDYADTDKDERLWKALEVNLAPHAGNVSSKIELWDPHKNIIPGQNKKQEIQAHIQQAHIFLLLLSPDYLFDTKRMEQILERKQQEKERMHIIPILLRPCVWRGAGLDNLQILPRNKVPISRWSDHDEALVEVTEEIYKVIDYIDKEESNNSSRPDMAAPTPAQPQQASTYNFQGPVNAGSVGDNDGSVAINHGGVSGEERPVSARQDVDVGIIIALKEEFAVLFAEIGPGSKAVRDPQTNEIYYRFERSSTVAARPYRCIATFIGGMGPTRAALQAEKMIARWNPSTLVLPGIAASLSASAKLGDIVVADQVDGYMENAKANPTTDQQGYDLAFSGEVYRTSSTLLKEVQNFEFSAPDIFQAWQAGTEAMQHELLEAERYELISKKLLRKQAQVIDGHIASGPVVDAAQAFTNWLSKRDRKYLALEMEAMGVMTAVYNQASTKNTGTLILRAISDYGNEEKSKLDTTGEGALRRYAMHNAIQLLWSFLDAGILSQNL